MPARVQVIDRAGRLLRLLARDGQGFRLRDLAAESDLSPSTTRRILAALVDNGLVDQNGDGSYRLGLGLLELGTRAQADLEIRERARFAMERLSQASELTSILCVRSGNRAVCIERIDGRYAIDRALTLGGSLPLHVGATPRVLLSYDSEPEIRSYLTTLDGQARFTGKTILDPDELIANLAESRAQGYVISSEDVTPNVAAVGAPIFGRESGSIPAAAISISGLVPHVLGPQRDRMIRLVCDAAEEVSTVLGSHIAAPAARNVPGGATLAGAG